MAESLAMTMPGAISGFGNALLNHIKKDLTPSRERLLIKSKAALEYKTYLSTYSINLRHLSHYANDETQSSKSHIFVDNSVNYFF
ncbi:MAG: hypothetical protein R2827_12550 [Bdellovibrionales bacterium]